MGDDAVRQTHDVRERTEIVLQIKVRAGNVTDEVLRVRTPPFVNGLVGITDDKKVTIMAAQDREELPVGAAAVLHFVDHDVLEPLLPCFPDFRKVVEDVEREEKQVVEIQCEIAPLPQDHLSEDRDFADGSGGGGDHETRDIGCRGLERSQFGHVVPDVFQDLLHERLHVLLVEDDVVLGIAEAVNLFAQEPHAEAVDGRHEVPDHSAGAEGGDAGLHLVGCLVGEGHAQDVALGDTQVVEEVGIAVDERPRLPGAGSGHDTHGPFRRPDGVLLLPGQGGKLDRQSCHKYKNKPPKCQMLSL